MRQSGKYGLQTLRSSAEHPLLTRQLLSITLWSEGIRVGVSMLELHRTTPLNPPLLSSQHSALIDLANMSFQTRSFGDKPFNAVGYSGMGLSKFYGSIGTDEGHLKVATVMPPPFDGWLTLVRTSGSGCRLQIRMYLLGHVDIYGDNEELIGKWHTYLRRKPSPRSQSLPAVWQHRFKKTGKRDEIFLATKFGLAHGEPDSLVKANPEYVHEALNKSLSRLRVDHIDLYYLHRADPTVPIEYTITEMAKLVK